MRRTSLAVLTIAAATIAFGACKNGSNNASDTLGVGAGSAAGQVPPGGTPAPAAIDTGAAAAARAGGTGGVAPTSGTSATTRADTSHRAKTATKKTPR